MNIHVEVNYEQNFPNRMKNIKDRIRTSLYVNYLPPDLPRQTDLIHSHVKV